MSDAQNKTKCTANSNTVHVTQHLCPSSVLRDKFVLVRLYAHASDAELSHVRTAAYTSKHRETTAHSVVFVYNTGMSECTEGSIVNFIFGCYGLPVMT